MPQSAGKRPKRGAVEQLPSFGVAFGPQSSHSRSKSRSTLNSRTFPAAEAPSYLAVAGEDLRKFSASATFYVALAVAVAAFEILYKLSAVDISTTALLLRRLAEPSRYIATPLVFTNYYRLGFNLHSRAYV